MYVPRNEQQINLLAVSWGGSLVESRYAGPAHSDISIVLSWQMSPSKASEAGRRKVLTADGEEAQTVGLLNVSNCS